MCTKRNNLSGVAAIKDGDGNLLRYGATYLHAMGIGPTSGCLCRGRKNRIEGGTDTIKPTNNYNETTLCTIMFVDFEKSTETWLDMQYVDVRLMKKSPKQNVEIDGRTMRLNK